MKFQNRFYYLQMNIEANRKNVTNDFRMIFRFVFVHAKTTLSLKCQKMLLKEDFNQNDSLSIS